MADNVISGNEATSLLTAVPVHFIQSGQSSMVIKSVSVSTRSGKPMRAPLPWRTKTAPIERERGGGGGGGWRVMVVVTGF